MAHGPHLHLHAIEAQPVGTRRLASGTRRSPRPRGLGSQHGYPLEHRHSEVFLLMYVQQLGRDLTCCEL